MHTALQSLMFAIREVLYRLKRQFTILFSNARSRGHVLCRVIHVCMLQRNVTLLDSTCTFIYIASGSENIYNARSASIL